MIQELRALHAELARLKSILPKPRTTQIRSQTIKNKTQTLVDGYFRDARGALMQGGLSDSEPADLDAAMQQLLHFTHRNVTASKYHEEIRNALSAIVRIEQLCLTVIGVSTVTANPRIDDTDKKIIQTLSALIPSAAASYEQATLDLQVNERLSWRGPATDLRESLRETLDHLAPDRDVVSQQGYRPEPDSKGPTMKQKVRYVLSKRGINRSMSATTEEAATAIDGLLGSFVRSIYTRSNISTHTPTDKSEVLRVRDLVRVALCELLEIPT